MRTLRTALLIGVMVAGFGTTAWTQGRPQRPPADARQDRGGSQYTLEQACSDRAQLTTIPAAWGSPCRNTASPANGTG